jgi:hypothetical protein
VETKSRNIGTPSTNSIERQAVGEAQKIANSGVPKKESSDVAGPDVTSWFACDLIAQLKHRFDTKSGNPAIDVTAFRDQAADTMSYKWMNFGGPVEGNGVNTVVLGNAALRKNQLGNLAFMVVGTMYPPSNFALTEARGRLRRQNRDRDARAVLDRRNYDSSIDIIAQIGYAVAPVYEDDSRGKFGESVFRADNLAAFGVGRLIAWSFMKELAASDDEARKIFEEKAKTQEGRAELCQKMEKVLRKLFDSSAESNQELAKAVNAFQKFQPVPGAPRIGLDALTFTPDYGGFNFNSVSRNGVKVFSPGVSSVGAEAAMYQEWKRSNQGKSHDDYRAWRKEQFEKWTEYSGYKLPGVSYPK